MFSWLFKASWLRWPNQVLISEKQSGSVSCESLNRQSYSWQMNTLSLYAVTSITHKLLKPVFLQGIESPEKRADGKSLWLPGSYKPPLALSQRDSSTNVLNDFANTKTINANLTESDASTDLRH